MSPSPAAVPAGPVPPPRASLQGLLMWGLLLALLAASWKGADMRPLELIRSSGNIAEYVHGFFPPHSSTMSLGMGICWIW